MPRHKTNNSIEPFTVSDRIRQLAKQNGWPNPDQELDAFVDYWAMRGWRTKSGPIVDREAAFRTWLRNEKKWHGEPEPEEPIRRGVWARKL